MRRRAHLIPLLGILTLVATIGLQAGNPPVARAAVTFTSTAVVQNGARCLDVFGAQTGDDVNLIQWNCHSGTNQSFTFTPISATSDVYTIGTFAARCADIAGGSTADNARAIQQTCNGGNSQRFRLVPVTVAGTDKTFNLQAVHSNKCVVVSAPATNGAQLVQLPCSSATDRVWRLPNFTSDGGGGGGFETLPTLPTNACNNSGLPRSFGTNFPTPRDPFAFGWFNQSAIGWQGNWYPAFSYLSGSYFARGVPTTFTQGSTNYCGAMYSFGVFTFGPGRRAVPAGPVDPVDHGVRLPARVAHLLHPQQRGDLDHQLREPDRDRRHPVRPGAHPDLGDQQRHRNGHRAAGRLRAEPGATDPGERQRAGRHDPHPRLRGRDRPVRRQRGLPVGRHPDLVRAQLRHGVRADGGVLERPHRRHRPAVAAQRATAEHRSGQPGHRAAQRLPGRHRVPPDDAGGQVTVLRANNYAWLLNHDVPGELVARFTTGDFSDARNLLLVGRTSEQQGFPSFGANWYWDGVWKTPWAWAIYLAKTNDTSFVSQFFNDNQTQFGPSLRTMMRTHFVNQLDTDGTLRTNFDNDSTGKWILSNYSALIGLAAYKYIATRIGQTAEATWAQGAYTSLHNALNTVIGNNQAANGFNFLPCEVQRPNTANRCSTFNDANWAQAGWSGQNQWDTMLMGGAPLSGIIGDPAQLDRMYQWGFDRLAGRVPFPSFGAFSGYSTAYNTAYSEGGLYGNTFRDLAITSYAWQIQTTTGGPERLVGGQRQWSEREQHLVRQPRRPAVRRVPYAWPIAHQQLALIRAVAAEVSPPPAPARSPSPVRSTSAAASRTPGSPPARRSRSTTSPRPTTSTPPPAPPTASRSRSPARAPAA
jgi:hypothetical protein